MWVCPESPLQSVDKGVCWGSAPKPKGEKVNKATTAFYRHSLQSPFSPIFFSLREFAGAD